MLGEEGEVSQFGSKPTSCLCSCSSLLPARFPSETLDVVALSRLAHQFNHHKLANFSNMAVYATPNISLPSLPPSNFPSKVAWLLGTTWEVQRSKQSLNASRGIWKGNKNWQSFSVTGWRPIYAVAHLGGISIGRRCIIVVCSSMLSQQTGYPFHHGGLGNVT